MDVIIDANIVMSILINPGKPLDLFLKEELEIFAPELILKCLDTASGYHTDTFINFR